MRNEFGISHTAESAPLAKLKRRRKRCIIQMQQPARGNSKLKQALNLNEMQRWVQEVTTHIDGVDAGLCARGAQALIALKPQDLDQVIRPSKHLSSHARIGIYADMYYLRLADCLAKDYAGLEYAFGAERFDEIARQYIAAHPSTHFSLNVFGAKLAHFLKTEVPDLPNRQFLVDLARLEWTLQEVFEDKNAKPLTAAQIEKIPKKKWQRARLELIPALRLLSFDFPANNFLQAVYNDKHPGLPEPRKN